MKKHEKYLEILKNVDDSISIEEWAVKFDETYPSDSKEEYTIKIRKIYKSISSLVSTGKWSKMLLIERGTKHKRIKFISDEKKDDAICINQHLATSTKGVKSVNFELLMNDMEYLLEDEELPNRENYSNFENNGSFTGYKEYIAFEMAIRNKDVINIVQKLDYIKQTIDNYQSLTHCKDWLLGIEYWDYKFEGEPPEMIIDLEQKKEYTFIAELPIIKFKKEIDFFITDKEIINEKSDATIFLKIIADYFQEKLIKKYHIYKDGYYFINESGCFDPDEVIESDSIYKDDFNTCVLEDEIKLAIDKFINRKADNMKQTADMFFMYDYYNSRKAENNSTLYSQDLKSELTKYHGIKVEGFTERFSYDECLERYEEFKDLKASFYEVERTITDKIGLMEKFIDQKLYKYILFY